jgi:hypothetical protein
MLIAVRGADGFGGQSVLLASSAAMGVGVNLVEHAVQHRLDPAPGVLGAHGHEIGGVVQA